MRSTTDFPNYYTAARLVRSGGHLRDFYDWTWFQRQMNVAGFERQLGAYTPQPPLTNAAYGADRGVCSADCKAYLASLEPAVSGFHGAASFENGPFANSTHYITGPCRLPVIAKQFFARSILRIPVVSSDIGVLSDQAQRTHFERRHGGSSLRAETIRWPSLALLCGKTPLEGSSRNDGCHGRSSSGRNSDVRPGRRAFLRDANPSANARRCTARSVQSRCSNGVYATTAVIYGRSRAESEPTVQRALAPVLLSAAD